MIKTSHFMYCVPVKLKTTSQNWYFIPKPTNPDYNNKLEILFIFSCIFYQIQ